MARASGAGAYSHSVSAGRCVVWRSSSAIPSVHREVVGALVLARALLADLHEHVVQERRGAEAEEVGRQPFGAERLVHEDEVLDGLLGGADAAGRLDADAPAGLVLHV